MSSQDQLGLARVLHNVQVNVASATISAGLCVLLDAGVGGALVASGITLSICTALDQLYGRRVKP